MKSGKSKKPKKEEKITLNEWFYGRCRNNFVYCSLFVFLYMFFPRSSFPPSISFLLMHLFSFIFSSPLPLSIPPSIPNFSPYLPLTRGQLAAAAAVCPLLQMSSGLWSGETLQFATAANTQTFLMHHRTLSSWWWYKYRYKCKYKYRYKYRYKCNYDTNTIMIQIQIQIFQLS